MLVTFATNKLEITISHSSLKETNCDFKIIWQRMRLPDFPGPWNKHCPVPMCEHPRKRSPGREWVQLLAVKFAYVPRGR